MGIQPQEAVGYNMQSLSLWECAVCSVPDPREMDNASSFFPPPEKLSVWQYLVWLATPGASVRHLWASKKKHTGRGRFPPCVAPEVLEQILGLISSHDFLDTTGACLLVIRPLDNLPRGGDDQLNEQWNNFMWPWTALTAWCVVQNLKKNPVILMDFNFHWEGCCLSAVFSFGLHLRVSLAVTPKYC